MINSIVLQPLFPGKKYCNGMKSNQVIPLYTLSIDSVQGIPDIILSLRDFAF